MCISEKRRVGKVWLVSNQDGQSSVAYFKQATPTSIGFSGPLPANEYLAYLLGKELCLPMAETILAKFDGIYGVLSLKKVQNRKLYNWNQIKNRLNPFDHVLQAEELIKMFVFDVWIINIDRNNRNIILYRTNKKELYNYYLIDHGLSLLGSLKWKGRHWDSPYWNHVYKYNKRYLKGLPMFVISNKEILYNYVKEVQTLPDHRIEEIIGTLPSYLLSVSKKDLIKKLLIKRKTYLHEIIESWIKEYQQHYAKLKT